MSIVRWTKDEQPTVSKGGPPPLPTLAAVASLAVPLVQEVVFLADFRCARCQQRVAEVMSKMNGETQSVVISVLEKKVTLTCTYPNADHKLLPKHQIASSICPRRARNKVPLVLLRLFRLSCS